MSLALECSTISKGGVSALASSRSSVTYTSTSPVGILLVLDSRSRTVPTAATTNSARREAAFSKMALSVLSSKDS